MRITILSWREGFNKVVFTQVIMQYFGYQLSVAKEVTDYVLEGDPFYLGEHDECLARAFQDRAKMLGAEVELRAL